MAASVYNFDAAKVHKWGKTKMAAVFPLKNKQFNCNKYKSKRLIQPKLFYNYKVFTFYILNISKFNAGAILHKNRGKINKWG